MADKEAIKLHVLSPKTDAAQKKVHAYVNTYPIHSALGDRWRNRPWIILGRVTEYQLVPDASIGNASTDIPYLECLLTNEQIQELSSLYLQGRIHKVKLHKNNRSTVNIGGEEYDVVQGGRDTSDSETGSKLLTFTFKVNPSHIGVQKRKLFTKLRTKGGFVFQHWGPNITEISVAGTTGNIRPQLFRTESKKVAEIGGKDITLNIPVPPSAQFADRDNSPLLDVFRRLEEVYNQDQDEGAVRNFRVLALEYRKRLYVGFLTDFFYEERAERPFQFYYKFTFFVSYEATSPYAVTSSIASTIVRNEETLQRIKEIVDESNAAAGIIS